MARFPCRASLPVFGAAAATHSEENNSLEHVRAKKTWPVGAASCGVIVSWLNLCFLMLCSCSGFCVVKIHEQVLREAGGPELGTDTAWVAARIFFDSHSVSESEH